MQMKSNKFLPKSKLKVHHQMMKIWCTIKIASKLYSKKTLLKNEKTLEYITKDADLIKDVMQIFDDGLEHMQKISQVEQLLLPGSIKTGKNGIPLKTINR